MANISDEGVDLGLALASRNHSIVDTRSNSSTTGAGGNAKSRMEMAFASSDDPLSELVWSPHNGLSLKCADNKIPFSPENVGPSSTKRSNPSGDEKVPYDEKLTVLQKIVLKVEENKIDEEGTSLRFDLDASHMLLSDAGSNDKMEEKACNIDAIEKEENRNDNIEEDLCSSKSIQIADIAESSKRNAEDSLAHKTSESKVNIVIRDDIISSAVPIHYSQPPMEIEGCAENDLSAKEAQQNNNGIYLNREKNGKEKAPLSENDEDRNSHASMESCNSATLFSKGVKRQFYEQGHHQLIESKRMKGNYGSASVVRPDSSFMNWISNMVKGLSDSNNQESSSLPLPIARPDIKDSKSPNMGFQNVFRSLYCQDTKKDNYSVQKSKELIVAAEKLPEIFPRLCEGEKDNSCKQIVLSNKEDIVGSDPIKPWIFSLNFDCTVAKAEVSQSDSLSKQKAKIATENTSPNIIPLLPVRCVPEKSTSLWITRLYTRTPTVENSNKITKKSSLDSGTDDYVDFKTTHKLTPRQQVSGKSRSSEKRKKASKKCTLKCFYCGRSDHDLRKCPELAESEIKDLLVKMSSFDGVEEYSRLCIRCFRCDHWAISCPSHSKKPSFGYCPNYLTWNVNEDSSSKRLPSLNEFRKSTASNSENYSGNERKIPRGIFVNSHNVGSEEEIFRAIKKLRLSRSDILRWMNSNTSSAHLNGFFLRLRLGKVEAGLGWTGYYVARITGYTTEIIDYKLKKSILVDVGGIKSSVGSQYVSNQDFLEDEIKAWWSRIAKTGDNIPLLDELNSKFEDRKILGF